AAAGAGAGLSGGPGIHAGHRPDALPAGFSLERPLELAGPAMGAVHRAGRSDGLHRVIGFNFSSLAQNRPVRKIISECAGGVSAGRVGNFSGAVDGRAVLSRTPLTGAGAAAGGGP